jgi:hypothetical protein
MVCRFIVRLSCFNSDDVVDEFVVRLVEAGALQALGYNLTIENYESTIKNALAAIHDLVHGDG